MPEAARLNTDETRRLLNEATPAPWKCDVTDWDIVHPVDQSGLCRVVAKMEFDREWAESAVYDLGAFEDATEKLQVGRFEDSELICHLRNNAEPMADEIDRLRCEVAQLRAANGHLKQELAMRPAR